jgi:hypothetical protein
MRISTIVVSDVVSGLASPGDSLQVNWYANKFTRYGRDDGQWFVSGSGHVYSTQLNSVTDQPALYFLKMVTGPGNAERRLVCTTEPLIVNNLESEDLLRMNNAAMTPLPVLAESEAVAKANYVLESNPELVSNCTAFVKFLKSLPTNEK